MSAGCEGEEGRLGDGSSGSFATWQNGRNGRWSSAPPSNSFAERLDFRTRGHMGNPTSQMGNETSHLFPFRCCNPLHMQVGPFLARIRPDTFQRVTLATQGRPATSKRRAAPCGDDLTMTTASEQRRLRPVGRHSAVSQSTDQVAPQTGVMGKPTGAEPCLLLAHHAMRWKDGKRRTSQVGSRIAHR